MKLIKQRNILQKMKLLPIIFIAILALVQAHPYRSQESDENGNENDYDSLYDPIEQLKRENRQWKSQAPSNWYNEVKNNPDAEPFLRKVTDRLENSSSLTSRPEVRKKLDELAHLKLYRCKSHGHATKLDRSCMGRWTGQMMRLIAGIENVNRDLPSVNSDISRIEY